MKDIKSAIKEFKRSYPTVPIDILHYILVHLVIAFFLISFAQLSPYNEAMNFNNKINDKLSMTGELPKLQGALKDTMLSNINDIKSFFISMSFITLLSVIFLIIFSGIFRKITYSYVKGKAFSLKGLRHFILNNSLWILLWMIIMILSIKIFIPVLRIPMVIIEILLFIHLSTIFRTYLVSGMKTKNIWKKTFKVGFMRFHRFILPLIIIILGFVSVLFIFFILLPLIVLRLLPENVGMIGAFIFALLSMVLLFIVASISRLYYIIKIESI